MVVFPPGEGEWLPLGGACTVQQLSPFGGTGATVELPFGESSDKGKLPFGEIGATGGLVTLVGTGLKSGPKKEMH